MPSRRIVIVTGAGASRRLGRTKDVPLMDEWARSLREECERAEAGLADQVGLRRGITAEQFEEAVGSLFGLGAALPLVEAHLGLGGPQPGAIAGDVQNWLLKVNSRFARIVEALHVTLYTEFGQRAIDESKAQRATRRLLDTVGEGQVLFATTNYDPALELGLEGIGLTADDGFRQVALGTPRLDPSNLGDWSDWGPAQSRRVPVLHLHGAVGWYVTDQGEVERHYADMAYNSSLGVPAILPPDPNKDPTNNAVVTAIWRMFQDAVSSATHVLVVGHSLRDRPLLAALSGHGQAVRLGVCRYRGQNLEEGESDKDDVIVDEAPQIPREATVIAADFGPDASFDANRIRLWLGG